ncbi:urease accessory protein UreF [Pseudarthrobacter sp. O4]|uniref:urease accessory protein UreF n=1 Tax=Pseudarthrobacter sp. O4 TaxID=3418417 RepID=UPI003CF0B9C7
MSQAPSYLLPLLQLSDSALPTGGFSHSFGMETFLERGLVDGEASFAVWLCQFVRVQLTHSDGFALRLAFEATSADELARVDRMLAAAALPREVREAGTKMGARMLAIAGTVAPSAQLAAYAADVVSERCTGHPAVAFAVAGRHLGVPLGELLASYLFATVTSLTQNAIRAIPIGQNAGQRVLLGAHHEVIDAVRRIQLLEPDDFGVAAPGLEIAQMRHERQRVRMFMS